MRVAAGFGPGAGRAPGQHVDQGAQAGQFNERAWWVDALAERASTRENGMRTRPLSMIFGFGYRDHQESRWSFSVGHIDHSAPHRSGTLISPPENASALLPKTLRDPGPSPVVCFHGLTFGDHLFMRTVKFSSLPEFHLMMS